MKSRLALLTSSTDEEVAPKATQRRRRLEVPCTKPVTAQAWQGLTHSEHAPGKCKGFGFADNSHSHEGIDNPAKSKKGLIQFIKGNTINLPSQTTPNEEAHSPLKEEQVNNL